MLSLRAPAKLNLYLRVLGRRPDGYHELETLFERIDLADELTFEAHPDQILLTCTEPTLSCGEENLILKAARLLQQVEPHGLTPVAPSGRPWGGTAPKPALLRSCGASQRHPLRLPPRADARGFRRRRVSRTSRGACIHLVKRIPIAAGLGGGSSDAATALLGLNQLWDLGLDRAQLARMAAMLGSDVPFFLADSPWAIGRGRGDACESLDSAARLAHVLVAPAARLSTREIYEGSRFNLTASAPSITMMRHAFTNGPAVAGLAQCLWNDLEPEAIRRCPVIALIQTQLHDLGCLGTRVSGSGPAVFGLCPDARHAQRVAEAMRKQAAQRWRVEVVQTDSPSLSPIGE